MREIIQKYYRSGVMLSMCSVFLSGCITHIVNKDPQVQIAVPEDFSIQTQEKAFQAPWWESFNRPHLNTLVRQSMTDNFDIAQATAVLEQAQSTQRQTSVSRLPQINLEGDASKDWEGGDAQRGDAQIGGALSWELDIWNRIGNAALSDELIVQARKADVEALQLSLSAEVANAYFGAVAAHQKISLLNEQLKLDKDLQELLELRLQNGVGTNVEVLQQQAQVANSETLIPLAESELAVYENRLDVLLGKAVDGHLRVPQSDTLDFATDIPAVGVPAALLLNRPDLASARAELIAADSDIAEAIADRLPRLTLDGSYALSDSASFTGPVSLIMGSFVQPLLDWGQRKAEVERNEALYQERLAAYTQLYLEAIEDVENALVQERKQREFLNRLDSQRAILQSAVNAAEQRYKQGVDDYQPVIDALRELRSVERDLVDERLILLRIRVDLFRSIGGPMNNDALAMEHSDKGNVNETP